MDTAAPTAPAAPAAPASGKIPPSFFAEKVTWLHHWTDRQFSFRTTRDPSFRFDAGQFVMIGLMVEGKPLVRAYSVASAPWEEELEFLSIKVQNGPLTSRLQHIQLGHEVLVGKKPTGTLLLENLLPGRNLFFFATGTGLAPFMSLIREPLSYEKFGKVVVQHTVREVAELAYRQFIAQELPQHEFLGELIGGNLLYYPSVTREPFPVQMRSEPLIESGKLCADLGLPPLDPAQDRVMLCGSEAFNADMIPLLEGMGFVEGNNANPGSYVVEKAFVTK
jgi:ferredoxin--NADP+ reductase